MSKPSQLSTVIRQYELELEMHERAIVTIQDTLTRLKAAQPRTKPARPRAVPREEKSAS